MVELRVADELMEGKLINIPALALALVLTASLAACGNNSQENLRKPAASKPGSVERCLWEANVQFAKSVGDLDFLFEAQADEAVAKPGIAFDKAAGIVVNIWSKAETDNEPPEWLMWIGQPFNQSRSPVEIVEGKARRSYVGYLLRPSKSQRRRAGSCITTPSTGPPGVILRNKDLKRID